MYFILNIWGYRGYCIATVGFRDGIFRGKVADSFREGRQNHGAWQNTAWRQEFSFRKLLEDSVEPIWGIGATGMFV